MELDLAIGNLFVEDGANRITIHGMMALPPVIPAKIRDLPFFMARLLIYRGNGHHTIFNLR